jgi:hypothetical protein
MFFLHKAQATNLFNRFQYHSGKGNKLRAFAYRWVLKHSYV